MGSRLQRENKRKIFVKKGRKKIYAAVSVRLQRAFAAAKSAIKNCPYIFTCPNGLVHMAIPIVVNNQYIGAIIGGPIRCEKKALKDSELGDTEQERKAFLDKLGEETEYQNITHLQKRE